jgi:murein L,D-transpeptidase YcbB/YkuD
MPFNQCSKSLLAVLVTVAALQAQAKTDAGLSPDHLRELLAAPAAEGCLGLAELRTLDTHDALNALYRRHDFAPLWQDSQRLSALRQQLLQLDDDGLPLANYAAVLAARDPDNVCDELQLSSRYLLALEQLSRGSVDLGRIEPRWLPQTLAPPSFPDIVELALSGLENVPSAFDAARPRLPLYRELRAAYAAMDRDPAPWQSVPEGPTLKPGAGDVRLAPLAQRLQQEGLLAPRWVPGEDARYGGELEQAVRVFQADYGLQVDGIVGAQTLAALNVSPRERLMQVRANLERLRWLAAYQGEHALVVNVAGGDIRLYQGEQLIWQSRVQPGRPSRPTPLLISRIDRLTLNPSWTVPPTIMKHDMLPKLRADPHYLVEHDLRVLDLDGHPLDPAGIDWHAARGLMLRQPPGPLNPLGRVVFRLQNPFAIYLHDTPSQNLFARAVREVSSGCVRVENAAGLADLLLEGRSVAQREEIARLQADGATHEVRLPDGPRLIITYWTAEATRDGHVKFLRDPYGLDRTLMSAMQ